MAIEYAWENLSAPGGRKTTTDLKLECFNSQNVKKKLSKKYDWSIFHNIPKGSGRPKVGCMDYKFRYCCKDLWGEPQYAKKNYKPSKDKKPPIKVKGIYVSCKLKSYLG